MSTDGNLSFTPKRAVNNYNMVNKIKIALKHLKEGKVAGYDSISPEELRAAGEPCVDAIHKLCNKIWNSEQIPEDWGKAIIVPIFKKKDKLDCANYRGISYELTWESVLQHIT